MTKRLALTIAVAAAALPLSAFAQSPGEVAYCNSLANTYVRYVGHDEGSSRLARDQGSTDGQVAVSQCRSGQAASAIPVLERELQRNGFSLPPRG
jgi:hypothetical protein